MSAADVPTRAGFLERERIVARPGFSRWLVPPAALAIVRLPVAAFQGHWHHQAGCLPRHCRPARQRPRLPAMAHPPLAGSSRRPGSP